MALLQSIKDNWEHYSTQLKIFIFGENNSRLDKLINQFYGMREEKRKRIRLLGILGGIGLFILILGMYFYQMAQLQNQLSLATQAYVEIQEFKPSFTLIQTEYLKRASELANTNNENSLIPAIQEAATRFNVQITKFSDGSPQIVALPATSVFKSEFKKAKIELQINSISVKHLVRFLNELHNLPNKFMLTKLEIIQVQGNKLYFDSNITLEAYVPTKVANFKKTLNKG